MKGSYQLDSFTKNRESEVKRLKAQVELFFNKEFQIYKNIGLKNGMRIAECGSGPGYLMLNILKEFPDCEATALEIDPYLYEVLGRNSIQNGKKVYSTVNESIYDTNLPENHFDFIITRLVIEHLENPVSALQELRRILKPDGKLVVVSNDFAYHLITYPVITQLDEMYAAYCRQRESEGGNALIGRQMPVLLERAGFGSVNFEVVAAHSKLLGDQAFLNAENVNISKSLVEEGFLKKDTLADLVENWFSMLKDPDHVIYRQLFIISGEKTTAENVNSINESSSIQETISSPSTPRGKDDLAAQRDKFRKLMNKNKKISDGEETLLTSHRPISGEILNTGKNIDFPGIAGASDIESVLLRIWKNLLNNDQISPDDNYFDIGGDSVLIPDIVSQLAENYNINIRILDIFEFPTIRQLSDFIKSKS